VIGCFGPLIAVYVREWVHAGALVFGVVSAMVGLGMIAGMPVVRKLSGTVSNATLVLGGLAGIGLGALLLGAFTLAPTAMLGTFGSGRSSSTPRAASCGATAAACDCSASPRGCSRCSSPGRAISSRAKKSVRRSGVTVFTSISSAA